MSNVSRDCARAGLLDNDKEIEMAGTYSCAELHSMAFDNYIRSHWGKRRFLLKRGLSGA